MQIVLAANGVPSVQIVLLVVCSAGSERSGCAISPAVVSVAMARLSPRWGSCRQEDAHEFMTALLDAMQTEVLAAQVGGGAGLGWLGVQDAAAACTLLCCPFEHPVGGC